MSALLLLTFNAGSSTIKIGLFAAEVDGAKRIGQGVIEFRHQPLLLQLSNDGDVRNIALKALVTDDLHDVLDETLNWFATHFSLTDFVSVGHRVVHGGDRFAGPVAITEDTLATIEALVPLAPLHQPQSLRLIRAIQHVRPHLVQSASFDTAFHRTQTDLVRRFALPRRFFDQGVKRYGFHGLSYQYIAGALKRQFPELAAGKVVTAHLGSGASWDSSMGFSTLDGIPMATRCGALDAGVVLHLLQQESLSAGEIEKILYCLRARHRPACKPHRLLGRWLCARDGYFLPFVHPHGEAGGTAHDRWRQPDDGQLLRLRARSRPLQPDGPGQGRP